MRKILRSLTVSLTAVALIGLVPAAAFAVPPGIATVEVPNIGPRPICLQRANTALTSNGWGDVSVFHGTHVFGAAGDYRVSITCTLAETAVITVAGTDNDRALSLVSAIQSGF